MAQRRDRNRSKNIEKISHYLSFVSPAEVKGFPVSEAELAKDWVSVRTKTTAKSGPALTLPFDDLVSTSRY